MFYDQKKPLKPQLDEVKRDIRLLKPFLDDYIVDTLRRHTDRDIILLSKIKQRTDEKFRIQLKIDAQKVTSDKYKRVIDRMKESI